MSGKHDKSHNVRVLIVEDSVADAELLVRELAHGGFEVEYERVEGEDSMTRALEEREFDLVVLDFNLPRFDAHAALKVLSKSGLDIPAIVVSGSIGEDVAVETMKAGAADYIMKDKLARLVPAVERELRDATTRRSQAEVEAGLNLLAHAIESASIGITIGSGDEPGNPLTRVNRAFMRITGYPESELVGRSCNLLQGPDTDPETVEHIRLALAAGRQFSGVILNYRKDGTPFWNHLTISPVCDRNGNIAHFVGIQVDVTAQRAIEERLQWVLGHDALTGLGNRTTLIHALGAAIGGRTGRNGESAGVIAIDLDRFGLFNDSFGRPTGDALLLEVSRRIRSCVPDSALISRTGADEFKIALPSVSGPAQLEAIARVVREALAEPFKSSKMDAPVSPSICIGLALAHRDEIDAEHLIEYARAALQHAKRQGRGIQQFYTKGLTLGATRLLVLESALREAIENGELTLHYQPQVTRDGHIDCFEALVRWHHPEHGLVSPADFIPMAEETGLIVPLGEWVLRSALRQLRAWDDAGLPEVRVAVNLAAQQLDAGSLDRLIAALLRESGLEARRLELEITESQLMSGLEDKRAILERLDALGVTVAIDDFGTGYSSLAYLRGLSVQVLKIDRSFVKDIRRDPTADKIVAAVSGLAHGLDLMVVAEGVETEEQRDFLHDLGCDAVQGYLYCKPLPADEAAAFLKDWKGI